MASLWWRGANHILDDLLWAPEEVPLEALQRLWMWVPPLHPQPSPALPTDYLPLPLPFRHRPKFMMG